MEREPTEVSVISTMLHRQAASSTNGLSYLCLAFYLTSKIPFYLANSKHDPEDESLREQITFNHHGDVITLLQKANGDLIVIYLRMLRNHEQTRNRYDLFPDRFPPALIAEKIQNEKSMTNRCARSTLINVELTNPFQVV